MFSSFSFNVREKKTCPNTDKFESQENNTTVACAYLSYDIYDNKNRSFKMTHYLFFCLLLRNKFQRCEVNETKSDVFFFSDLFQIINNSFTL